jgi:hypothetical protein
VTLGWLLALLSPITTGAVFGWIPHHTPLWDAILWLSLLALAALRRHVRPAWHPFLLAWQTLLHGRQ